MLHDHVEFLAPILEGLIRPGNLDGGCVVRREENRSS